MKVEIRPIEELKWHKKKGKESFTAAKKIRALVDGESRKYATGLSNKDIEYLTEKMGVKYDLSDDYSPEEPHPFWDSPQAVLTLENKTMIFDTDKPLDYILVKIAKASKFVANSKKEYEKGVSPFATHIIYDEREEVEVKASKVAIKKKAIIESSKLSLDKKTEIVMILSDKLVKGKSEDFIEVALDELIETKAEKVLNLINQDDTERALHALVLEALQKSVLRRKGHKIMYFDFSLGVDIQEVIDYLAEDENQDIKLKIMAAVN